MAVSREVKEGEQVQGIDEELPYSITTTPWGSSPSNVVVTVHDTYLGAYTDVTTTVLPAGSVSVVGDEIFIPKLKSITELHPYRVKVKFDSGSATYSCFFVVKAEK